MALCSGVILSEDSLTKIAKRQKQLGLLDREIAAQIGVCRPMYSLLRVGKKHANPKTIHRLCQLLSFRLEPARLVSVRENRKAPIRKG